MPAFYTADAIREAEHATGELFTGGTLMARAAHAVAVEVLAELGDRFGGVYGRTVLLLVGAGDNGGDALYAARHLRRRGVRVVAIPTATRIHEAALADFLAAGGRRRDTIPDDVDLAVDAIVGLGGRGPLREPAATLIAELAARRTPIVAVDLPSGVDPDTGVVNRPSVRADVSVTFGLRRLAHLLAAPVCGRVVVADIGIPAPPRVIERSRDAAQRTVHSPTDREVADLWPVPGPSDDKYTQGVVGVIAGSARYPGAAVLCTTAAIAATSGMTRYVGPAVAQVLAHRPEIVAVTDLDDAGRVQAWVIGPGFGTDAKSTELLERVLDHEVPVLVDADALTVLAANAGLRTAVHDRAAPTLLTPHAGEFARIANAAGSEAASLLSTDRPEATRRLASDLNASVLLKGHVTLVADADGSVSGSHARSSWAATAGSGDVLAGIIGALLAAGLDARTAGVAGARLHARAAVVASGGAPIGASDLAAAVRPALIELMRLRQWNG
ncbi:bifunctional NAD(P)H-hydrate repair enzyme [Gordonia spumicola]|uniref:Bifunctional NAD(P)H-hydrate repair enzyme n=1 Tax=Gordonia spumicola TaxID=589161 RepID=A0A7I9V9F6_9ACTN|nr:NAD(P)H-hydrate dehydratase [Gordonia spumicola]GEE01874.1 bifunctional NAD(P)H-hydrate repair enzyme [Gordonia spumicola]